MDEMDDSVDVAEALRLSIGRIARKVRQVHVAGESTLSERSVLARLDREGDDSPGGARSYR
jgi:hypothetical protein